MTKGALMSLIPNISARALASRDPGAMEALQRGAHDVGFFKLHDTGITADKVRTVIAAYAAFFDLPDLEKTAVDMAQTGANRGWGAPQSEQVDPDANPDYKQVFDMGHEWPELGLPVYAPNQWPIRPEGFRATLESYYAEACDVARGLLGQVIVATGGDPAHFAGGFDRPMALLRGNGYPPRPDWAGDKDFGIAAHTDYGCLTLLATDGVPGLEVQLRSGDWVPVDAAPGEFVINFGEMLEIWTNGAIRATPHRVVGTAEARVSVPLFFNPRHDVNVAARGARTVTAFEHLSRRFKETYVHLQDTD